MVMRSLNAMPSPYTMLLSVCATTLSGCTATPQSSVHQKLWTRICPLLRSMDASAMPAVH
jgi:hypothetical protein